MVFIISLRALNIKSLSNSQTLFNRVTDLFGKNIPCIKTQDKNSGSLNKNIMIQSGG